MHFLAQKHIHHGDLAARNILLTDTLIAKISDFGLSRRLYEDVTEPQPVVKQIDENNPAPLILPMKWLALDVLLHQKRMNHLFTPHSPPLEGALLTV